MVSERPDRKRRVRESAPRHTGLPLYAGETRERAGEMRGRAEETRGHVEDTTRNSRHALAREGLHGAVATTGHHLITS